MANSGRRCKWCNLLIEFRDGYWRVIGENTRYCVKHDGRHEPEPISGEAPTSQEEIRQLDPELYEQAATHVAEVHEKLAGGASTGEQPPGIVPSLLPAKLAELGIGVARPMSGTASIVCNWRQDGNPPFNCKLPANHSGEHSPAAARGTEESAGPRINEIATAILNAPIPNNSSDDVRLKVITGVLSEYLGGARQSLGPRFKADTLFGVFCGGNPESIPKDRPIFWEGWQRVADYVNHAAAPSPTPRPRCPKCRSDNLHIASKGRVRCFGCFLDYTIENIQSFAQFFSAQKEAGGQNEGR